MSKKVQLKTITAPKIKVADFHGDKVEGVRIVVGGKPKVYVLLRRLCENLGVDFSGQRQKLMGMIEDFGNSTVVKISTVAEDGKKREQLAIDLDFLPVFLMSIKTKKVKPELREKLKAYKREAKEVLARYFIDGEEASPTSKELVRESISQATILPEQIAEFKSILEDLKRKEEKLEVELAEAKKELLISVAQRLRAKTLMEIKADLEGYKERHENVEEWVEDSLKQIHQQLAGKQVAIKVRITVKEFLESEGFTKLTSGELAMFGRFARAEFEKKYGRPPTKAVERIRGGTKEVTVYYYNAEKDYDILKRSLQRWVEWRESFLSRKKRVKRRKSKEVSHA
ncbi:phage antirepressor N-terminal domain-containing protein [Desulfurobacterium sp.]